MLTLTTQLRVSICRVSPLSSWPSPHFHMFSLEEDTTCSPHLQGGSHTPLLQGEQRHQLFGILPHGRLEPFIGNLLPTKGGWGLGEKCPQAWNGSPNLSRETGTCHSRRREGGRRMWLAFSICRRHRERGAACSRLPCPRHTLCPTHTDGHARKS